MPFNGGEVVVGACTQFTGGTYGTTGDADTTDKWFINRYPAFGEVASYLSPAGWSLSSPSVATGAMPPTMDICAPTGVPLGNYYAGVFKFLGVLGGVNIFRACEFDFRVVTTATDQAPPDAPALVGGEECEGDLARLFWSITDPGDIDRFEIERDGVIIEDALPASARSYTDTTATVGNAYTYRVFVYDTSENWSVSLPVIVAPCLPEEPGEEEPEACDYEREASCDDTYSRAASCSDTYSREGACSDTYTRT